ncbi:MAG: hypothetical protein COW63_18595 [Bacteroidetes bacterium CG18_big_fil_WC_8_21_14_2_50_41_14]|nr:MAG: hypothetical protein COW63_18595 [Bacteroidetes bacterium CG18_big_fil_WC_8_21_14_2_50_41_14]
MAKRILTFIAILWMAFYLSQCAHPVMPSGGEKDVTPPRILYSTPPNGSANFKGNRFTLNTSEYVVLKNVLEAALISPPMKKFPDFSTRGKSIQVKFNEDLKPNTTYSVYFGDAIADLTETNPLLNYSYIFSTGTYVDSLSLYGTVQNAQNLLPEEQVFVMLYKDDNDTIPLDSLPFFVPPYYVSKSDASGKFSLNGLAEDRYLIFALKDQNANFIFDQPGEEIAFLDSLVHPFYDNTLAFKKDIIVIDSIIDLPIDTAQTRIDSIYQDSVNNAKYSGLTLMMFMQYDSTQRLLKAELSRRNNIKFSFSQPAKGVDIIPLNFNPDTLWHLEVFSAKKDTVTWYLKTLPLDTLEVLIKNLEDTLGLVSLRLDPDKTTGRARQNKKKNAVKEYLEWTSNIKAGNLMPNKKPEISFLHPMVTCIADSAYLVAGTDTIPNPPIIYLDSLHQSIRFPMEISDEFRYKIYYPDSSFIDWNGFFNKEISISFAPRPLKEYGVFNFSLHPETRLSYILQMLTVKEVVVKQIEFTGDTTVVFEFLTPGKYLFKVIFDRNKNHQWDTGDYGTRRQPEEVIYFSKEIDIRANWEIEEEWEW